MTDPAAVVVDTSALIAILQEEPQARECEAALQRADSILISAGTLAFNALTSASTPWDQCRSKAITWPVAWTPVSVRPAASRRTGCPAIVASASSRSLWTVAVPSRWRWNPQYAVPSYATVAR